MQLDSFSSFCISKRVNIEGLRHVYVHVHKRDVNRYGFIAFITSVIIENDSSDKPW